MRPDSQSEVAHGREDLGPSGVRKGASCSVVVLVPREKQLADGIARARRGDSEALATLLRRNSKMPSPRPNMLFADEVAAAAASTPEEAFRVAESLIAHHPGIAPGGTESEFLPMVGLLIAVAAVERPAQAKPARGAKKNSGVEPNLQRVLDWVHDASDDMRFHVRDTAVLALCRLFVHHEAVLWHVSDSFLDGYFPAAAYIRALGDRKVVDGLQSWDGVKAVLERALELLLNASRSDERYPGYKELLAAVPGTWALLATRFGADVVDTLLPAVKSKEPGLYEAALRVALDTQVRARFPEASKRIETARNEVPRRFDPRNERLKKKPRR